ncbi:hypothetical protein [Albibacterium profundi]|uniref:Phage head morphogenesis domain-containing protein n=1 Tax=Albibacterium profundi TaxID=3134906 RepID=A0ABV5CEW6_9SPHI
MAKKNVIGGVNWDASAFMANEAIAARVKTIHNTAIREASAIAAKLKPNPDKIFTFDDYPQTKKLVDKLFSDFAGKMTANIKQGNTDAFAIAHAKNDALLDYLSKKTKIPRSTLEKKYKYGARNLEGLQAFQSRKTNGLNLSDRVWKISKSARKEIELGIDLGLEEGMDAAKLSRKVRQNLADPGQLFRRVRDKHGNLKLSKRAKELHPGQGVYRSSYKNAMRLTRTEINMAYRTADHDRWASLDFIVGIEVKLSNNPNHCPTCIELAGKYPKEFKFVGWHPQCRCFATPILPTEDEYDVLELMLLNEEDTSSFQSVNMVKTVPTGMIDWINNNKDRAKNWKSMPYFVRDNFQGGKIGNNFAFRNIAAAKKPKSSIPQIKDIGGYKDKYSNIGNYNQAKQVVNKLIPLANNVQMGAKVSKEAIPDMLGALDYLTSNYVVGSEKLSGVMFKGGARYHGRVVRWSTGNIKDIDFGSGTDRWIYSRKRHTGAEILENLKRGKSAVDEQFNSISTIVHEYAHVIATRHSQDLVKTATGRNAPEFFEKLNTINKDYHVELRNLMSTNKEAAAEIYLGRYASTNINELMAEGFTEFTLSKNPSKYALRIGNLIDEYFRK